MHKLNYNYSKNNYTTFQFQLCKITVNKTRAPAFGRRSGFINTSGHLSYSGEKFGSCPVTEVVPSNVATPVMSSP
jgi:hypothetical protein